MTRAMPKPSNAFSTNTKWRGIGAELIRIIRQISQSKGRVSAESLDNEGGIRQIPIQCQLRYFRERASMGGYWVGHDVLGDCRSESRGPAPGGRLLCRQIHRARCTCAAV
jgi:hypothetical protein